MTAAAPNRVFVVQGDISRFAADAVGYSTSTHLTPDGYLYSAFERHVPGFAAQFAALGSQHSRQCLPGEAFWIPLAPPPSHKPRGVVVAPAAGASHVLHVRNEQRPLAVTAALQTAIANLRKDATADERLLIALPTFGFGMGGDRRRRLESARSQMAAAQAVLDSHANVDVAFVAYTADSYEVLLRARREEKLSQTDLLQGESVAALIDALRKGECAIFAGAGLSQGAGLPSWEGFIRQLAQDLGAPQTGDLEHFLDVAQWYVEERGEARLAEHIHRLFGPGPARPTLAHYLLMSLPVRVVVTTNYDDLLEQTLESLRRYPTRIIEEGDVAGAGHGEGVSVVKLHGDAAIGRRFVLSRDDFDRFLRQRPAMASLFEGLLLNHSFFFVGYGLRDPNFRQIHGRIAEIMQSAQRQAFAVTVDAPSEITPFLHRQWLKKGLHLLFMPGDTHAERVRNLSRFLDQLAEAVNAHSMFLADDAESAAANGASRLAPLRNLLREQAGNEVQAIIATLAGADSESDARRAADVLGFLTDHGWRPLRRPSLTNLWERIAACISNAHDRKRLLIRALRHAEQHDDIVRLLDELRRLEESAATR